MQKSKKSALASAVLLGIGIVFLICGMILLWFELPKSGETHAASKELIHSECKQAQSIVYSRCGHEVLRRIDVPAQWIGMSKETVLREMDESWRLTSFSSSLIEMSCEIDMFCPQHWVLTMAVDGSLLIQRNRLGFAMENIEDLSPLAIDEQTREKLALGIPFDSKEALRQWVLAQSS